MFDIERLRTHESFASNKTIIEGQFLDIHSLAYILGHLLLDFQ